MEICQDCKDKLVKFYHFKQKALQVQSQFKLFQPSSSKVPKNHKKPQSTINNDYQEDLTTESSYEGAQNSSREIFKIESAVSLNALESPIEIKEEHEEPPDIVFADYSSDFSTPDYPPVTTSHQRQKKQYTRGRGDSSKPLSKAAIKMRLYRERLKLPENRARYLLHQQQQREYNKRHYMRKQGVDLRRKSRVNYSDEYDFLLPDDSNGIM